MICSLAKLGEDKLGAIQDLEKNLGKTILAFSCADMKPAEISDDELGKIKEVEGKLGLSLVAVQ